MLRRDVFTYIDRRAKGAIYCRVLRLAGTRWPVMRPDSVSLEINDPGSVADPISAAESMGKPSTLSMISQPHE